MLSKPRNILFVAFEFPPLLSGGIQRSLYFVKYLPSFGINPVVITPEEKDIPNIFNNPAIDSSLLAKIPEGTIIERVHCGHPPHTSNPFLRWVRMYFSVTENFKKYWKKPLQDELPGIIEKYNPAAIYVTIPPFAMAPLWLDLLKNSSLPLIIDFRDAWSQWALAPNGSYFHYLVKCQQESAIIKKAHAVIVTSDVTKADLQHLHKHIGDDKIHVISNGFDTGIDLPEQLPVSSGDTFIIGYVGNFYYSPEARENIFKPWWKRKLHRILNYVPRKEDWLYRSPYYFFKAVHQLIKENPEYKNRIEIHFVGHKPNWIEAQIREFGLEDNISHLGFLPHNAAIDFQKKCDALLITSAKVIGGRDYSIAGKTFEYMSIGKPILAFVCEGAQKDILQETGMSVICNPDDKVSAASNLKRLIDGSVVLKPQLPAILKYQRKKLTEKLADVIHEVI